MKSLAVAFLIVGSVVGAGFASGRELVTIFGGSGVLSPFVVAICMVLIFFVSVVFLLVANKLHSLQLTEPNNAIFGKFGWIVDSVSILNSLIILSAMLAGINAIGVEFLPESAARLPIMSTLSGVLAVLVVRRGIGGLVKLNFWLLPIIVGSLTVTAILCIKRPSWDWHVSLSTVPKSLVYIGLNMYLAANAMYKFALTKRQAVKASLIASVVLGALMLLLILAINSNPNSTSSPLPILYIARAYGTSFGVVITCVLVVCIFTSMCLCLFNVVEWLQSVVKSRVLAGIVALIAALTISSIGFEGVVAIFYPIIGVCGIIYILSCLWFVLVHNKKAKTDY